MAQLVSVVIITHNEAPRLRLSLESFLGQTLSAGVGFEIVVVDDGSTDDTASVLADARTRAPLRVVTHPRALGRSAARNAGASAATGTTLLMIDGDVLASPDLVARHAHLHATRAGVMGRGETFHLRSTRFFLDPETGSPMPGQEARVERMSAKELEAARVTGADVRHGFDAIRRRGEPGIYAGSGPRTLYELEMRALRTIPDASILWMTASGHNFSLPRDDFLAVGGYDPRITINEHRELAMRLCERGLKVVAADGARSFHMLHQVGWRDPLLDQAWERAFFEAHPCLATKLMNVFWLSLAGDRDLPEEARIPSLEAFEAIVQNGTRVDYDDVRRRHPKLAELS